jgi:hypothetical protein
MSTRFQSLTFCNSIKKVEGLEKVLKLLRIGLVIISFESQRGHIFFGISPRGEISQEGFVQGLVSPPATSQYIGSVRIISEAPLVCPNGC